MKSATSKKKIHSSLKSLKNISLEEKNKLVTDLDGGKSDKNVAVLN